MNYWFGGMAAKLRFVRFLTLREGRRQEARECASILYYITVSIASSKSREGVIENAVMNSNPPSYPVFIFPR